MYTLEYKLHAAGAYLRCLSICFLFLERSLAHRRHFINITGMEKKNACATILNQTRITRLC